MPRAGGASSNHRTTGDRPPEPVIGPATSGRIRWRTTTEWKLSKRKMARHQQHRDQASGGSPRQLRVGELIRHELADMLTRGDIHDPVIQAHMITVPEVRMTADLRLATIYVMPLGGRDVEAVIAALDRNK